MPALKNPRHERFAQELAQGKTADEAYQLAGYKPNRGNAIRLKANERARARVDEIQARGSIRAEVTIASLTDELEEARQLATKLGQASAAVSASMGKAKINGKIIDQVASIPLEKLTRDELVRLIELRSRLALTGGIADGVAAPGRTGTPPDNGTEH